MARSSLILLSLPAAVLGEFENCKYMQHGILPNVLASVIGMYEAIGVVLGDVGEGIRGDVSLMFNSPL